MTKFERILTEKRVVEFLENLETLSESQAAEVIANLDSATIETINEVIRATGITPEMASKAGLTVLPPGQIGQGERKTRIRPPLRFGKKPEPTPTYRINVDTGKRVLIPKPKPFAG